jgi:hypothetical protein
MVYAESGPADGVECARCRPPQRPPIASHQLIAVEVPEAISIDGEQWSFGLVHDQVDNDPIVVDEPSALGQAEGMPGAPQGECEHLR